MKTIYLDYAATTPVDPRVLETLDHASKDYFANPSSLHRSGQKCKVLLEQARYNIAKSIDANPEEIIFTGSGTESNNLALIGSALALRDKGNHIITSSVEHPSVLRCCEYLERVGFTVDYLPVNQNGQIDLETLYDTVCKDTILISMMYVNNETGTIFPISEVGAYCWQNGICFHTDAVQAFGKVPCSVKQLHVSLMTLNAHKIYGPKGIAALYIRKQQPIRPIVYGGSQEYGLRPGTENLINIMGFARAVKILEQNVDEYSAIKGLRDRFEFQMRSICNGIEINGDLDHRVGTHANLYIPAINSDTMLIRLDMNGIEVSAGAACHSGSASPSHVLQAMGFSQDRLNKSIRFSFGRFTSEQQINNTITVLKSILEELSFKQGG
jgi:cysteine desulfurase